MIEKCLSLLFAILRSLNVSSELGDVFILMCMVMTRWTPVILLFSNRPPSRTRSHSTGTRVFWFRFASRARSLDKSNGGSGNKIGVTVL